MTIGRNSLPQNVEARQALPPSADPVQLGLDRSDRPRADGSMGSWFSLLLPPGTAFLAEETSLENRPRRRSVHEWSNRTLLRGGEPGVEPPMSA